ncbi:MAG: DUF3775 domain-containing protein [Alphaproteobacteria bacterium]|nr:DUF3775 domain-containing protein [Alphaproteobacteria bacterium]
MELTISLETVCRIILRAREYEAQVPAVDPDDGSNPSDDRAVEVLEDENNPAVEEELTAIIEDLAEDEQAELIALALVGRGSYDASEWDEALTAAAEEVDDPAGWLMGLALLSAYLEAGLAAFDLSCDDIGQVV